jgi:iron complex outermembrane receptor protein
MKTEQDINGEVSAIYETKAVAINVSAYRNQFFNYIYLNPTDEEYFGFKIYRYVQKDAFIQGGETSIDVSGGENIPLDFSASYSIIRAETMDGEYLPFIPSDRIQAELKLNVMGHKHHAEDFIKAGVEYNFDQDHQGQFETSTPAYTLVDVGGGAVLHFNKQTIEASVVCNNLLNEAYFDALSRFKEFAILNQGRNINLNIKIPF